MPKKKIQNFKQHNGPSNSSSSTASNSNAAPTAVNERLNFLRSLPSEDSDRKKRQLAESANQSSVPPELGNILGIPESAPPRPKAGPRFRDRMRTPGPPPPRSWLAHNDEFMSSFARRKIRAKPRNSDGADGVIDAAMAARPRPKNLMRFAQLSGLSDPPHPHVDPVKPSSLTHFTLKRLAQEWNYLDRESYCDVAAALALPLRLRLLSYLGIYGQPIDTDAFQCLTQEETNDSVKYLDIAALVGYGELTLKRLSKIIHPPRSALSGNDIIDSVPDSWDFESELGSIAISPTFQRFQDLTHLCLSHPPTNIHWGDLLSFSENVPQVTHLSLAYWPRPTLTPNLATTTVTNKHGPAISAGGSNYYSDMDEDFTEAAVLLRRLSQRLLRLRFLDLEGCADWFPALALLVSRQTTSSITQSLAGLEVGDDFLAKSPYAMEVFSTTWKSLKHIVCSQGWLPPLSGLKQLPPSPNVIEICPTIVPFMEAHNLEPEGDYLSTYLDSTKRKALMWVHSEYRLRKTIRQINICMQEHKARPVVGYYGWCSSSRL